MSQVKSLFDEVLSTLQGNVESLKEALQAEPFPLTNYVVMSGTLCLTFDVRNGLVTNPQVCPLNSARRFSQRDAIKVASKCRNGFDKQATAMTVQAAATLMIAELQGSITALNAAKAGGV